MERSSPRYYFLLEAWIGVQKIHRFVQYNPKKCFNTFVQSAVNARRQIWEAKIQSCRWNYDTAS